MGRVWSSEAFGSYRTKVANSMEKKHGTSNGNSTYISVTGIMKHNSYT